MYFIYCVRKKQISKFKVDEISTPSDKCSVSTSIVCDSDAIVYLHNPQIPSENTAYIISADMGPEIHKLWSHFSHSFPFLVRGCFRKSNSRANTNTFHSKVVAHFLFPDKTSMYLCQQCYYPFLTSLETKPHLSTLNSTCIL